MGIKASIPGWYQVSSHPKHAFYFEAANIVSNACFEVECSGQKMGQLNLKNLKKKLMLSLELTKIEKNGKGKSDE